MRLRLPALLVGVSGFLLCASGQEQFTFTNYLKDTADIEYVQSSIERHYLGESIAIKLYRIQETYTYETNGSVNNPVIQTVIEKPTIYHSLKKLNAHYKKQLKKGLIDSMTAKKELGWYLDIGFAIYNQNTDDFEAALKEARKPDEIAQVFAHVILK